MKSVIASCLAVTVAAVAFIGSELRDETLWWEEKFVVMGPGGVLEGHRDRTEVDGSPRSNLCGPDIDDDDGEEQGVAADLIRAR